MRYKNFKDGVRLSCLGFGAMRLPVIGEDQGSIDYDKARNMIDYAYRSGVNYFDTAYIYHNSRSEEFVGRALKEYPRDSYYVADKFNFQAQPDYKIQFQEQLQRLDLGHIDFYLLHGIQDPWIESILGCGCVDYFETMRQQGKIRYLGFSFHGTAEGLRKLLRAHHWDFVQIQLNYFDWYCGEARALYEILEQAGIPIMVMEPVRGGRLAALTTDTEAMFREKDPEASMASWAIRWVMSRPQVQVILSGMSSMEQTEDNIRTVSEKEELSAKEEQLVRSVALAYRKYVNVTCTACHYCCPDCPKGLDIPKILAIYNDMKMGEAWRAAFADVLPEGKRPEDCIGCGSCMNHCPQGIDVPSIMKEFAEIRK